MTLEYGKTLAVLAAELRQEIVEEERNLLRAGRKMQSRAKQLVPVDEADLKNNINLVEGRLARRGYYVEVGIRSSEQPGNLDHALPVEYGKKGAPAQPYMRPAYYEAADELS